MSQKNVLSFVFCALFALLLTACDGVSSAKLSDNALKQSPKDSIA